jgi:hypothetical protein
LSVSKVNGGPDGLHITGRAPFDQPLLDGAIRLSVDADGGFEIRVDFAGLRCRLDRLSGAEVAADSIGASHLEIYYVANGLVDETGGVVRGGQKRASVDLGISPSKVSRLTRRIVPIGQTRALEWTEQSRRMLKQLLEEG